VQLISDKCISERIFVRVNKIQLGVWGIPVIRLYNFGVKLTASNIDRIVFDKPFGQ
jgi:hypothetical protein